jgi:hypothetical protein
VLVPPGVMEDLAGNLNEASNIFEVIYDTAPPSATITGPAGVVFSDFEVFFTFSKVLKLQLKKSHVEVR